MNQDGNTISRALTSREALVELVAMALILAFGVNLASANVAEYWGSGSRGIGIAGWILILTPVIYLLTKLGRSLKSTTIVNAVVALDIPNNKVIEIPGYVFSEKLQKVLNAAFVENEAYLNIWNTPPLLEKNSILPFPLQPGIVEGTSPTTYSAVYETENENAPETGASKLLVEAVEYLLIESISDQLSDYFNSINDSDSKIKELTGQDIPDVLLSNRLLRLFTTPLEERPIYTKVRIPPAPQGAVLKSITGSDGSLFRSLGIYVPKDSSISRPKNGALKITSSRANISLTVKYTKERQASPEYFEELYLGKHPRNVGLLKVTISLDVSVRLRSLLKIDGWRYYQWADGLPTNISKAFDFTDYIALINWSQVRSQARVNTIARRLEQRAEQKGKNVQIEQ